MVSVVDKRVLQGDCRLKLNEIEAGSVDAVITDPPYDLTTASRNGSARKPGTGPFGRHTLGSDRGFMGKTWDGTGVAFDPATWTAVARVAKPEATIAVFGGSRTWHRVQRALIEAGLSVHGTVMWVYSSGFPKSLDASKAIDAHLGHSRQDPQVPVSGDAAAWAGWGTALKPAWEPIIIATNGDAPAPSLPSMIYCAKAPKRERPRHGETAHPTVKPLELIRTLVASLTEPGATILDPFLGSGTLAEAAIYESREFVGCELTASYLPLIHQRIRRAERGLIPGSAQWANAQRSIEARQRAADAGQLDLFDAIGKQAS